MISYLQKISYAKRDSDVIAKVKGTYSDKNKLSSKRKEEDDAEALAKKKKKVAAKYANDFSIFVLTVKILLSNYPKNCMAEFGIVSIFVCL